MGQKRTASLRSVSIPNCLSDLTPGLSERPLRTSSVRSTRPESQFQLFSRAVRNTAVLAQPSRPG